MDEYWSCSGLNKGILFSVKEINFKYKDSSLYRLLAIESLKD